MQESLIHPKIPSVTFVIKHWWIDKVRYRHNRLNIFREHFNRFIKVNQIDISYILISKCFWWLSRRFSSHRFKFNAYHICLSNLHVKKNFYHIFVNVSQKKKTRRFKIIFNNGLIAIILRSIIIQLLLFIWCQIFSFTIFLCGFWNGS